MSFFLLDTDVLIDVLRGQPQALRWLAQSTEDRVGLPGLAAMEVLQGPRNASETQALLRELLEFEIHWPTEADCLRAMTDFAQLRLRHGTGLLDVLIAHTAIGAGAVLCTFNLKHYRAIVSLETMEPFLKTGPPRQS